MQINETKSYTEYRTNKPTTDFVVGFEYFNNKSIDTVNITVDGIDTASAGYVVSKVNNSVFRLTPAVPSGRTVRLLRETDLDAPIYKFSEGALFRAPNVDANFKQILHAQQEVRDYSVDTRSTVTATLGNYESRIKGVETTTAVNTTRLNTEITERKQADTLETQARVQGDLDNRRYAEDLLAMGNIWDGISARSVWDNKLGMNQADINSGLQGLGQKWKSNPNGYALNDRVMLDNGDIVKSTVANNIINPNVNMTGWVKTNTASQIFDANGLNQQEINNLQKLNSYVTPFNFGAKGDDINDDTAAIQAFVNYLTTNHVHGYVPKGTYKLTSKINFVGTYGWGIIGAGAEAAIFKQYTNNIPCFDLGAVAGPGMHSYLITDIMFDYNESQPAENTRANPIYFSQMGYEGELNRITFQRGSWAIGVKSGVGAPWGQHWDNLNFGRPLTGGAMDWTGATNAVPNNQWGRFLVTAKNMVGPIFKQIKGYNWVWNTLELLDGVNCQWIDCQAGADLNINAIKMELCTYTGAPVMQGGALMYFPSGNIDIGQLSIGGTFAQFEFTDSGKTLFNVSNGSINVSMLSTALTVLPTNFYLLGATGGDSKINYRRKGQFAIDYTPVGSSASSEYLSVYPDKNDKLSANKGDADYTVIGGDPANIRFETPLTAQRVVNLPSGNNCFNGLRYRIASSGAVNGANTILINASGVTKATLSTDKSFIDVMWRRNPTPHNGWVVVSTGTLP